MSICKIEGCERRVFGHGWCQRHYSRWRSHGDPLSGRVSPGLSKSYIRDVVLTFAGEGCLHWPYLLNDNGYARITDKSGGTELVSRRVCEMVHGPAPSADHYAAHSCGQGHEGCVNPKHLRWATPSENQMDRIAHGTHGLGERNPMAKLTADQVRQIRTMQHLGSPKVSRQFGVSEGAILMIWRGKTWASVS